MKKSDLDIYLIEMEQQLNYTHVQVQEQIQYKQIVMVSTHLKEWQQEIIMWFILMEMAHREQEVPHRYILANINPLQ